MGSEETTGTRTDALTAIEVLSAATGEPFRLIGPLAGGETGATEIEAIDGSRHVLKWEADTRNQSLRRTGARLADLLRENAAWPAPRQRLVETDELLFVVQEFMTGTTVEHLSHDLVDQLLELHETRLGIAGDEEPSHWVDSMIQVLTEGGNGYCLHTPLRTFDPRTRRTVERIEEIGRTLTAADLPGNDVVHGDLHPGNLLQANGRLSAVVDLDYARIGDPRFDLTTLAVSSLAIAADRGVRSRLFEHGVHDLPDDTRRAYAAYLLLGRLDWSIRKHRPEAIEFWLARTDELLAE